MHNCWNKLYNCKSITYRNNGLTEGYSLSTCCIQLRRVVSRQCRQQAPSSTSYVDNAIDLPWRNFQSPESGIKFQREVPLFLEIPKFPHNTVWDRWKEAYVLKTNSIRFDTTTDGRTDGQTHDDSKNRASMAPRGKNDTSKLRLVGRLTGCKVVGARRAFGASFSSLRGDVELMEF